MNSQTEKPTIASILHAVAGGPITNEFLEWPADLFAHTNVILDAGAQGVLLTVCGNRAPRRSADGPYPIDNTTEYFDVAVHQVRTSNAGSAPPNFQVGTPAARVLEADDLTI